MFARFENTRPKCHPNDAPLETVFSGNIVLGRFIVNALISFCDAGGISRLTVRFQGLVIVGAPCQHMAISTGSDTLDVHSFACWMSISRYAGTR